MFPLSEEIQNVIYRWASEFDLPPQLVAAIVIVESSGNPAAWRVEPFYRWLWNPRSNTPYRSSHTGLNPPDDFVGTPGHSKATAWVGQKTSWGLMQIMGAVARELGFKGWFPELCQIDKGIEYGCRHLHNLTRFKGRYGWEGVIAAYNAGTPRRKPGGWFENQEYVNKVMSHIEGPL